MSCSGRRWSARAFRNLRAALESEENDVLVSVASAWEIAIKVGQGKWPEARDLLFDFERHMEALRPLVPLASGRKSYILAFEGDSHVEWFEANFADQLRGRQEAPPRRRRGGAAPD